MTNRLYYEDSYLTSFTSHVVRCEAVNETDSVVYLDESAFYPTSGGQPFDTGLINGLKVTDVFVDRDGDVAHRIEGFLEPGTKVDCLIDWARRFDHMQQHAGEHMLAGSVYRQFGGKTIGLHLGHSDSSIDVELPGGRTRLEPEELQSLEDDVNQRIQNDEKIRCWFPDAEELERLPLRKAPAVTEHVRVVQIGNDEFCACGGTHPSSAGQIGLVKIIDARPSKGKLRLTFLCGNRAYLHYRKCFDTVKQLSSVLSAEEDKLTAAAEELMQRFKDVQYLLNRAKARMAVDAVKTAAPKTVSPKGFCIVKYVFEEIGFEALKEAASEITRQPDTVALLASKEGQSTLLLFARSEGLSFDMNKLLKEAVKITGGKGGGTAEFARGSSPDERALYLAESALLQDGGNQ